LRDKIIICNPEHGFALDDKYEAILWYKWLYWSKGISTREFKKEFMADINDVMAINSAINEKNLREKKLRQLMANVGVR
jgi:hypothetical protein